MHKTAIQLLFLLNNIKSKLKLTVLLFKMDHYLVICVRKVIANNLILSIIFIVLKPIDL